MLIFFEVPILLVVVLAAGILGLDLGPILIVLGLIGLFFGLFFVIFADADQRAASACLFLLPNVLIIFVGLFLGEQSLFDLLF